MVRFSRFFPPDTLYFFSLLITVSPWKIKDRKNKRVDTFVTHARAPVCHFLSTRIKYQDIVFHKVTNDHPCTYYTSLKAAFRALRRTIFKLMIFILCNFRDFFKKFILWVPICVIMLIRTNHQNIDFFIM